VVISNRYQDTGNFETFQHETDVGRERQKYEEGSICAALSKALNTILLEVNSNKNNPNV